MLAKSCVLLVLCIFNKFIDHGGHRGNMAQALARWWHPVATSVALDVLHRAMSVSAASYHRTRMAIEIASNLPAFLVLVNFVVVHNRS